MNTNENFGLEALGTAGPFTIEVLSRSGNGWLLSIDAPSWRFDFDLLAQDTVGQLAAFLRSHAGRAEFAELVVGSFVEAVVLVVKDDEFADRFFLRAVGGGGTVEFTLVETAAEDFAAAIAEAAADFETGS